MEILWNRNLGKTKLEKSADETGDNAPDHHKESPDCGENRADERQPTDGEDDHEDDDDEDEREDKSE